MSAPALGLPMSSAPTVAPAAPTGQPAAATSGSDAAERWGGPFARELGAATGSLTTPDEGAGRRAPRHPGDDAQDAADVALTALQMGPMAGQPMPAAVAVVLPAPSSPASAAVATTKSDADSLMSAAGVPMTVVSVARSSSGQQVLPSGVGPGDERVTGALERSLCLPGEPPPSGSTAGAASTRSAVPSVGPDVTAPSRAGATAPATTHVAAAPTHLASVSPASSDIHARSGSAGGAGSAALAWVGGMSTTDGPDTPAVATGGTSPLVTTSAGRDLSAHAAPTGGPRRGAVRTAAAGQSDDLFAREIGTQTVSSVAAPSTAAPAAVAGPDAPEELPAPAHEQISAALAPIRGGHEGDHRLTVQLHPADLGPVSVVARLEHGSLTVTLASTSDAARDTLHSALPQLRHDLQDAGFGTVAVSVDTGGAAGSGAGGATYRRPDPPPMRPGYPGTPLAPIADPSRNRTTQSSALDRLL